MAEKTPTIDEQLAQLEKDAADFHSRANPDVRKLAIPDYARAIRREHQNEMVPDQFLPDGYLPKVDAEAVSRYDADARELSKSIADRVPMLRTALTARMADERRLRGEAERLDPNLAPDKWLQAMNVDMLGEQRAEVWLDKHADDERAIIDRLQRADARRDGAFLRLAESRYGMGDDDTNDPKDATERALLQTPLRRAIRERQDARVRAATRAGLQALDGIEATYLLDKAEAFPSDENITKAFGVVARGAR